MKTLEEYQQDLADLKTEKHENDAILKLKTEIADVKRDIISIKRDIANQNEIINKPD